MFYYLFLVIIFVLFSTNVYLYISLKLLECKKSKTVKIIKYAARTPKYAARTPKEPKKLILKKKKSDNSSETEVK